MDTSVNDPTNVSWDGKLNGVDMNPAVFVYVINIEDFAGVRSTHSGDVTLSR